MSTQRFARWSIKRARARCIDGAANRRPAKPHAPPLPAPPRRQSAPGAAPSGKDKPLDGGHRSHPLDSFGTTVRPCDVALPEMTALSNSPASNDTHRCVEVLRPNDVYSTAPTGERFFFLSLLLRAGPPHFDTVSSFYITLPAMAYRGNVDADNGFPGHHTGLTPRDRSIDRKVITLEH